jgi:hypothetical protein
MRERSRPPERNRGVLLAGSQGDPTVRDFIKTLDHLDKLMAENSEYTARALPWSLVLASGLAKGYMELADHYELGARVNKSDPSLFRKQVSQCRGFAGRLAMQVADNFGKLQAAKDEQIPPASLPARHRQPRAQLTGWSRRGPQPAEMEAAEKRAPSVASCS